MNKKVMDAIKIGVTILGVGVTLAQNYFEKKDLDAKVAEKVAEALKETKAGES